MSVQYTAIFHGCKKGNFQRKKCDFFLIFAQNIDRGYTLEPPLCFRAKLRKNVHPGKPHFSYIKVGCKGVFITRTCFHDDEKTGHQGKGTGKTQSLLQQPLKLGSLKLSQVWRKNKVFYPIYEANYIVRSELTQCIMFLSWG